MAGADRLIEVFNEAKARPVGAERDGFLALACRDDAELKGQVLSLLGAHEGAGEFLGAGPALSPEIEAELARLKPEGVGERIGPYKLREQIGEGGFGVVWVAEQQEPVRRTVALKIIKISPGSSTPARPSTGGRSSSWNWCTASGSPTTATKPIYRRQNGSRSS